MKQGWTYKKLGELGTIVTGSTPSTKIKEYYCSNDYCFIKPSDLPAEGYQIIVESENYISSKGYEVSRKLPKGSVLVSCIGIIGKTAILGMDACTNQQINAIIPNEYVNNKFLAYSILSQRYVLSSVANAPVVPLINKSDFSKVEIPLPPLSVQHSIVSELDKINELIRLKKEQLKDYDNLAQSIFYEMFGDPAVNDKNWKVMKLGEICRNCDNLRKPITASDRIPGSIPYYGASGIVDYVEDYIFSSDYLLVSEDGANLLARTTPIAFSISGKTWVNNHAHVLEFKDSETQLYVEYLINSVDISNYITGAVQPKLNQAKLNVFPIPLPPHSLQQLFAQRIELIEQQKAEILSTIQDLETLLASRMQYWFD